MFAIFLDELGWREASYTLHLSRNMLFEGLFRDIGKTFSYCLPYLWLGVQVSFRANLRFFGLYPKTHFPLRGNLFVC